MGIGGTGMTVSDLQYVPVGAVVARCELVDVVPILPYFLDQRQSRPHVMSYEDGSATWLNTADGKSSSITDQRPYGDFTPGRYAWLLADIRPVDPPVEVRGRQGLWRHEGQPALTLWQPWASLVAAGVKTVETRHWSTKYRGPLIIHAAARRAHALSGHIGAWRYNGITQCLWRDEAAA